MLSWIVGHSREADLQELASGTSVGSLSIFKNLSSVLQ